MAIKFLNTVQVDTDVLYVDASTNKVGIGTTSPSTVLEVSSSGVNGVDISQSASNASQSGRLFFTTNTASEGFALFNSNGTFQVNSGGIPNNTSGTNRISIIGSSGNVGIGTTSPGSKLEVAGEIDSVGGDGYLVEGIPWARDNSGLLELGDWDGVGYDTSIFGANGNLAIRTQGGNVGIGTTNPQAKLHVANGTLRTWVPSSGTSAIFESTVSNRNFVTLTAANEAELWFGDAATQTKGRVRYEMAGNNMEFWTNATQKMVINGSGNVGIGTISPGTYKLAVAGSTNIGGNVEVSDGLGGDKVLTLTANTGSFGIGDIDGLGDQAFISGDSSNISINVNGNTSLYCDSNNRVGIGTTSPAQKLHVVGRVASTNGNGFQIINSYGSPLLSDFYGSFYTTASLYVGSPYSGQACYASAFNITSDYRLKENEAPLTEASSRIKKLKPIRFNYISSENTVDGFLAHEVGEVIPEAVTGEKDAVREDGSDELQGLDLSKIVPLLTAALQETITKIEQLEQRIKTLENK